MKVIERIFSGHLADIVSLDMSRSGGLLVSAASDGRVIFWEVESGKSVRTLFSYSVTDIALSLDSKHLAIASCNKSICIVSTDTGTVYTRLSGHKDRVFWVAVKETGNGIVSVSRDGTLRVWDLISKEHLSPEETPASVDTESEFTLHGYDVAEANALTSPDGKWVSCGAFGRGLRFWNLANGELDTVLYGHESASTSF